MVCLIKLPNHISVIRLGFILISHEKARPTYVQVWKIYILGQQNHHLSYSGIFTLSTAQNYHFIAVCGAEKENHIGWSFSSDGLYETEHWDDVMRKSFCEALLQYYPKISEVEDIYSTSIANCAFNSFLSYIAIMLNIVTIHAIRKTLSLPKTLKTLLLSLAVSDVGVGLLVQPFYISLLVKWIQENDPGCNTYMAFNIIVNSFWGVVALSVDRFLAIHLHLRYQELVTHKRVVAVVISIWVLSAFFSLMPLWVPTDIRALVLSIGNIIGLLLTTLVYIKIYLAARHHRNQIQVLQVQNATQNGTIANFAKVIKSSMYTYYVYLVFLACYFPLFISWSAFQIINPSIAWKKVLLFSLTLVYVNSSLNPVIYCWKMRHIQHAVMNILRNYIAEEILDHTKPFTVLIH